MKLKNFTIAVLLGLMVAAPMVPMAGGTHTFQADNSFTETFETYSAGLIPAWPNGDAHNYDYRGSCTVSIAQAQAGTKSLNMNNAECVEMDYRQVLCGATVDFWWRFDGSLGANFFNFGTGRENGAENIGQMRVVASGVSYATVTSAGALTDGTAIPGFTPAEDTWYHSILSLGPCSDRGSCYGTLQVVGFGTSGLLNPEGPDCNDPLSEAAGCDTASGQFCQLETNGNTGFTGWLDNIRVYGLPITADDTTDPFPTDYTLVGFDEDYAQKTVIARLQHAGDLVQSIYTFDPQTLNVISTEASNCIGRNDGVMSYWADTKSDPYVGYLDCQADPSEVDTLKIRNNALAAPDQTGTICDPAVGGQDNFCNQNLENDIAGFDCPKRTVDEGALNTDMTHLGQILAVPISYDRGFDIPGVHDYVSLGFAYVAERGPNGVVGSYVQSQINDFPNLSCYEEKLFSTTIPSDMCAFRGNRLPGSTFRGGENDYDFVIAAGLDANTLTWNLTFTTHTDDGIAFDNQYFVPHMNQVSQLQTDVRGIGCSSFSNSTLLISTLGAVNRYNVIGPNLGAAHWPIPLQGGITAQPRGVTMSRDGLWGAYAKADGTWAVFNATGGTVVASGPLPSGNYFGMRLSGAGNDLLIATSDSISRFHVGNFTHGVNRPDNVVCDPDGTNCETVNSDGSSTDAPPPEPETSLESGPGCTQHWDGEIVIGVTYVPLSDSWTNCASMAVETGITVLLFVAGLGFTQWKIRGRVSPFLLSTAGILGLFLSVFLWQFPLWPFVVMAAVGVAFTIPKVRSHFGSGDE